ncbi:MAG: peptidoglycan DD-metalloendopeptidase family protein [Rikenellaceae bacterium]
MSFIKKNIIILSALVVCLAVAVASMFLTGESQESADDVVEVLEPEQLLYDINIKGYNLTSSTVRSGESLSTILAPLGVSAVMIDKIARTAEGVYSLKNMRAGNNYTIFSTADSLSRVEHFVYERTAIDFLSINIIGDSVSVSLGEKPVSIQRRRAEGVISSSLWNCMVENDISPALAMEMSDIYAWSIDFFGLQKDDSFKVIYDEKYIDTVKVGSGTIWGMEFSHSGKTYYAIPFSQEGKLSYWDEQGNSLRKNLLKAPLKYSRISSTFSYSRLHPILKIRRPHLGVDYAAPMGTPVVAVADGVVTFRAYSGGGGNTLKIKHASSLESGYLHLKSFAKGITVGSRVSQGQLIGYVGSTGMSTGPHLDFRIWKGGKAIDPLKVPSEPVEPISEQNKEDFDLIKMRIMAELEGNLADNMVVNQLDSLDIYRTHI